MPLPSDADFERIDKAATFDELFTAYRRLYGTKIPADAAGRIFELAEAIAANYPTVELWDCLNDVLDRTMGNHNPAKGPFSKFFAWSLHERMRRERARNKETKRRERDAEVEYAARKRPARISASDSFRRWSLILLEQAIGRLDPTARAFVRMRLAGDSVKDIADALGINARSLSRRFGKGRIISIIREEARRLVEELSAELRGLLVQHLLHEARLHPTDVERLLGGDSWPRQGSILTEDVVLARLGWHSKKFANFFEFRSPEVSFEQSGGSMSVEAALAC